MKPGMWRDLEDFSSGAVCKCWRAKFIKRRIISGNGFEKDLEEFCSQNKRVVALSAGTAAIHLALIACGVKTGDKVYKKVNHIRDYQKLLVFCKKG